MLANMKGNTMFNKVTVVEIAIDQTEKGMELITSTHSIVDGNQEVLDAIEEAHKKVTAMIHERVELTKQHLGKE